MPRAPSRRSPSAAEGSPTTRARGEGVAAAVYADVRSLRPWGENYRRNHRVEELARTILRTRWGAPILAQLSTRRIIGGHGRSFAALAILEGIVVDGIERGGPEHRFDPDAPSAGMVPVRFLDVSDAEADALAIADNARGLQGEDDVDLLVEHLKRFGIGTALLDDMGYTAQAVEALLAGPGADAAGALDALGAQGDGEPRAMIVEDDPDASESRAEELRAKWGTERGQLWEIPSASTPGAVHRILCGDSTDPTAVALVMGGDVAVLLHTDPPYGVDVAGGTKDPRDAENYRSGGKVENDALSDDDLRTLVSAALANCRRHMADGAAFYVWHADIKVQPILDAVCSHLGQIRQIIVWVKEHFVFGRKDYHYQHEPCFYGWVEGAAHRWLGDRKQTSVWQTPPVGTDLERKLHPTAKPVALPARAIQNHVAPGEIVVEPFSGSGSTMVAAEKTGRLCRAVELAPKYVAVALERMATMGLTPRLVTA